MVANTKWWAIILVIQMPILAATQCAWAPYLERVSETTQSVSTKRGQRILTGSTSTRDAATSYGGRAGRQCCWLATLARATHGWGACCRRSLAYALVRKIFTSFYYCLCIYRMALTSCTIVIVLICVPFHNYNCMHNYKLTVCLYIIVT